jgi:rubrerythrin
LLDFVIFLLRLNKGGNIVKAFKETIKMIEGVQDEVYWVCGECGEDHDNKEEADSCCNLALQAGKFYAEELERKRRTKL